MSPDAESNPAAQEATTQKKNASPQAIANADTEESDYLARRPLLRERGMQSDTSLFMPTGWRRWRRPS